MQRMLRTRLLRFALVAGCAALGTVVFGSISSVTPVVASPVWRPIDALRYFVDDAVDDSSRVYRGVGYFLVRPSDGGQLFLLSTRESTVSALATTDVVWSEEGAELDAETIAAVPQVASYSKEDRGRWLRWQLGETAMAVGPKPELLGVATLEQVLAEKEEYRTRVDEYQPDPVVIGRIARGTDGLELVIGFGTWCPICAEWTPRLIKTVTSAGIDAGRLTFVSTDPEITRPAAALERYGIDGVPVFIVFRDGKEIGRIGLDDIDRDPSVSIESHLARILNAQGS